MATKAWWLFSFIDSSGYYKKEQTEADTEKIKNLYYNNGTCRWSSVNRSPARQRKKGHDHNNKDI